MSPALLPLLVLGQSVGPPPVTWWGQPGDAAGASGANILFEPLRLGLSGDIPPMNADPSCKDTTIERPASALFAKELAPRLTLVGLTRGGCVPETAIGAGLVYVVPIRPKIFFVAGAGATYRPPFGNRPWIVRTQVRGDVVFDRGGGRSYSVGIGTRGMSFGGVF